MRVFGHAVASFEPTSGAVMIWTRLSSGPGPVAWAVAADPDFEQPVSSGLASAEFEQDCTVTVDVGGLQAATTYFYRFEAGGQTSPIGRTRTLPAGDDGLTLAMVSCARYAVAPLTVYRALAETEVDLVVHMGDYIYEDDGDKGPRAHDPPHTATTLQDYRRRLAQIRSDPDAQALHLAHPLMILWDDHDFADNAGLAGAKAHDPVRHGPWQDRRDAARRAHREWLPRRSTHPDPLVTYRSVVIGDVAELILLDSRIIGRDMQASHPGAKDLDDPSRRLLGTEQMQWLAERLNDVSRPWALVASSVVVNPIPIKLPLGRLSMPLMPEGYVPVGEKVLRDDQWDGYPAERDRLVRLIAARAGSGGRTLLLSGDVHSSWAFNGPSLTGQSAACVEMTVPSVSSAPLGRTRLPGVWRLLNRSIRQMDHVHWAEITARGFGVLQINRQQARAGWWFVDPYDTAEHPPTRIAASFCTELDGRPRWQSGRPPVLPGGRSHAPQPPGGRPHDVRFIRRWHKRRRALVLAFLGLSYAATGWAISIPIRRRVSRRAFERQV